MRLQDARKMAMGPRPGSPEFGEQARDRIERLRSNERRGDLRVRTARKTVGEAKDAKNRYLAEGD